MRIDVVSIFPEYLAPLGLSLIGKAREAGILELTVHDLRSWTTDRHRTVDDTPYGGGPGMVMSAEPWAAALDALSASGPGTLDVGAPGAPAVGDGSSPVLVVPTPSGERFTQDVAAQLSDAAWLVFAPARYEGIDARFVEEARTRMTVRELSIGDYVLAGGEVAVLVIIEAVARLLPGVLGNPESHADDSFASGAMAGLLEGPVYTKPASWRGREVPEVLLSGNHAAIAAWRREQALRRTAALRPDLLAVRADPDAG